jgi:hypothetical protein
MIKLNHLTNNDEELDLSYDAKEYYHFSEVVDEFCKKGWTILNQMF